MANISNVVLIGLGFIPGLVIGLLWREAWELWRGRDDPMSLYQRSNRQVRAFGGFVRDHAFHIILFGLMLAMVFAAAVGVVLTVNDKARDEYAQCTARYNELESAARTERAGAANEGLIAQRDFKIDLRNNLRDVLKGKAGADSIIAGLNESIDKDNDNLNTQAKTPYPPPDMCEAP